MTTEQKDKLKKIYELVKRGSTDGERDAARKAIDRMLAKLNLQGIDLESLDMDWYTVTYTTDMEVWLLDRLFRLLLGAVPDEYGRGYRTKKISMKLTYLDYITISSAYEYFRRHMKGQWTAFCAPNLKRCRTVKSRNARRKALQSTFWNRYAIASNFYKPEQLTTVSLSDLSQQEQKDRIKLSKVEGGSYKVQVTNGLLLN